MNPDTKKQLMIFLTAGMTISLLVTVLPSMNNTHGEYFSGGGIDSSPPVTSIEYSSPFVWSGGNNWINTNTTVYVNATDESGVNYTHYEIWKDADGNGIFETLVDGRC